MMDVALAVKKLGEDPRKAVATVRALALSLLGSSNDSCWINTSNASSKVSGYLYSSHGMLLEAGT
jgi:hypothetical protein